MRQGTKPPIDCSEGVYNVEKSYSMAKTIFMSNEVDCDGKWTVELSGSID
jgi:hypothetical protein